ncbi:MAG: hypothetical protein HON37_13400 [Candidatus Marinimicrobia bacterium]|nr:hypothetical protein [Candidatus Neomarinimicrobiota bacterium]MBT5212804.1 hypothetical protein [Candidatus Neomarinimicrobiota bacterium]
MVLYQVVFPAVLHVCVDVRSALTPGCDGTKESPGHSILSYHPLWQGVHVKSGLNYNSVSGSVSGR